MKHELMELPYGDYALEPMMSSETLLFHHDKHHAGYVSKLNRLISGTEFESQSLVNIIKHAAQVYNHDFFFSNLIKSMQMVRLMKKNIKQKKRL